MKQKIKFTGSASTKWPTEELVGYDKVKSLVGKMYRLDLIAFKEGQGSTFTQERLFVPEETMNSPETVKRLCGEACYRLLKDIKSKHENYVDKKLRIKVK